MIAYNFALSFVIISIIAFFAPAKAETNINFSASITHKLVSHYQTNLCLNKAKIPIDSSFCKAHFLYGSNASKNSTIEPFHNSFFETNLEADYSIKNIYNDQLTYGLAGKFRSISGNEFSSTNYLLFLTTGVELFLGNIDLFELDKVYLASNNFIERSFGNIDFVKQTSQSRSTNNLGYADSSLAPKNIKMETGGNDALSVLLITKPIKGFKLGFGYDNRQVFNTNKSFAPKVDHKLTFLIDYITNTVDYQFLVAGILSAKINNDYDENLFPSKYDNVSVLLNFGFRSNSFEMGLSTLVNLDHYNPEGRIKCSFRNGAPIESFCLPSIAMRLSFVIDTNYFKIESAGFVGFTPGVLFRNYLGHPEDSSINVHGFDFFYKIGSSISKEIIDGFEFFLEGYYFKDQPTVDVSNQYLSKYSSSSGFYFSLGSKLSF